jgi:predicted N-acyltransferase
MLAPVDLTLTALRTLEGVESASWDALDHAPSPFLEWGFLRALELSGSVGARAGWDPHYLMVEGRLPNAPHTDSPARADSPERRGTSNTDRATPTPTTTSPTTTSPTTTSPPILLGAVAAYVKDHSYGEYIFDFHWARASTGAGIAYYPKLVIAAPATPATGRRILLHPGLDAAGRDAVASRLIAGVRELADETNCGSIHWLFTTADERERLVAADFAARSSYQFHWHNRGYACFDDFLAQLTSRKRKQIRKERQRSRAAVDAVRFIPGPEITPPQLAALQRFYTRTCNLYGGRAYLRPSFFAQLLELAPERVRFLEATRAGSAVAGALFFETPHGLYGRYWGCDENIEFLHFEASYYAGIERCIALGLPLFEAGAQGEHKLLRGFEPVICHSTHSLRHPGLDRGVREFLREETLAIASHVRELESFGPYREPG